MKIVVDENIPVAEQCFGQLGHVVKMPGRELSALDVREADALVVRSITRVNRELLSGSRVKFVGTATIGTDHVDTEYLLEQGICFASAPGCNARSVVEYVMAALLELEVTRDFKLPGKSIGIIGVGNVGRRLQAVCESFGLKVLPCDPPRQARGDTGLVSAELAWQADIVSLHTPYIRQGAESTHHLANETRMRNLKPGAVIINTSRGGVLDNMALSRVLEHRFDLGAVLDVWESEPFVNIELANQVDIATPHIAGYSYDGKVRGTWMIYQAMCEFLQVTPTVREENLIDPELAIVLDLLSEQSDQPVSVRDVITRIYDIREDDVGLRSILRLPREQRASGFDALRKQYRVRREFSSVLLRHRDDLGAMLGAAQHKQLKALGL